MIGRFFRLLCPLALAAGLAGAAATDDFFEARVRPVLARNCYNCHTDAHSGGLRLDSAEAVAKGGQSGPPIVPGKPDESLLVQAIRQTHPRLKMPPGGKLKDEEIACRRGVDQGGRGVAEGRAGAPRLRRRRPT